MPLLNIAGADIYCAPEVAEYLSSATGQIREDAVRQIVLASNALHTSLSAYAASRSVETAAQTTFDAALSAYRSGVGSITDLTLAESLVWPRWTVHAAAARG